MVHSALDRLRHALQEEDIGECPEMARDLEKLERLVGVALRPSVLRTFAAEWTPKPVPEAPKPAPVPEPAIEAPVSLHTLVIVLAVLFLMVAGSLFTANSIRKALGLEVACIWFILFHMSVSRKWGRVQTATDLFGCYYLIATMF